MTVEYQAAGKKQRKQNRADLRRPKVCRWCSLRIVILNSVRDFDGSTVLRVCDAPDRKTGGDVWVDPATGDAWVPLVPSDPPPGIVPLSKHDCPSA